jgi:hypothetical protein
MKEFNIEGLCNPDIHYMVDITGRLLDIKRRIDRGKYFVINRPRQYGKSTALFNLRLILPPSYDIISISLGGMEDELMQTGSFCKSISMKIIESLEITETDISDNSFNLLSSMINRTDLNIFVIELVHCLKMMCKEHKKPIVFTIDEIDGSTDSKAFINLLAQLRDQYLYNRKNTFQSVILAGVRDIRNLKTRIRPNSASKGDMYSQDAWASRSRSERPAPWNIAEKFDLDMSFSSSDISTMLKEYDVDHELGMDIDFFSNLLYEYTSGYPVLVSGICKQIDAEVSKSFPDLKSAWSENGFLIAEKEFRTGKNDLIDSLNEKLVSHPRLKEYLRKLLSSGQEFLFSKTDTAVEEGALFGFIVDDGKGLAKVSNRFIQTYLYEYFANEHAEGNPGIYDLVAREKGLVLAGGVLDMETLLLKFTNYIEREYRPSESFKEDPGRFAFITYIKLLLNGAGFYFIENETADKTKADIAITYFNRKYIVETKIWRGQKYVDEGEEQLADYLESFGLDEGYLLVHTFLFNNTMVLIIF